MTYQQVCRILDPTTDRAEYSSTPQLSSWYKS